MSPVVTVVVLLVILVLLGVQLVEHMVGPHMAEPDDGCSLPK